MTHFGLLCPPVAGHLNPMIALGVALQRRGHLVTMIGLRDAEKATRASDLGFEVYGERYMPAGRLAKHVRVLGRLSGLVASFYTTLLGLGDIDAQVAELPAVVRRLRVEVLVVDKASAAGGTVADLCGVPFVTTMGAFIPDLSPEVPAMCFPWQHKKGTAARWRNSFGNTVVRLFAMPHVLRLNWHRWRRGLRAYRSPGDWCSPVLQICPIPEAFELPRKSGTTRLVCVGPFLSAHPAAQPPFPLGRLTGAPLIYASMGTLHTRRPALYGAIVEATRDLGVQVALSFGNGGGIPIGSDDSHVIAVEYAPQRELLARACLAITHGGLNTVMEALGEGVPLVVIPIANDQPGVAERVRFHGLGAVVPSASLTAGRLRAAIELVLSDKGYAARAKELQKEIAAGPGDTRAAALIEQIVSRSS